MDVSRLPFDSEAMLAGLRRWVECESPTWDTPAVNRMLDIASGELATMGAKVDRIAGRMGRGDCVRARFGAGDGPGLLVMAHLDTVHPIGTLAQLPFRREGEKCYGPGICDMKGGTYAAFEAIRQLLAAGALPMPLTVLLTPDEEIGSPSSRALIEAESAKAHHVLVPEPARGDGGVVSGRYAIARFDLVATGTPSHAGSRLKDGRSAIAEMARQTLAIEAMTTDDCTFSVGVIHGGQWVNCVATTCTGEALSMAKRQADLDRGVSAMLALAGSPGGASFAVTRGVTRPVWEPSEATLHMVDTARGIAAEMGYALTHQSAGGGSDGNFSGAMGIPTLDGLGVRGDGVHTLGEYIVVDSLAQSARLIAGLLDAYR
ncbi:M20/M25/M40 family metallo-hydrolase [Acidisphaera sp. L21]|uniref:M20/M25/M40 family metallo-hydrolase n=1 Tax=Acidisphaera sp. L21 TaxID=1641851 RepID=UPI00131A8F95|nr:M20/M25/M40 family metallo-hydrolase [Acidisphaera sp. L21]